MTREAVLARALVGLADTLVDDFDVVELVTTLVDHCVQVLDIDAAGIMLADPAAGLQVLASSDAEMRLVELFEVQSQQGPCLDCFQSGQPIVNTDLTTADGRWPQFAPVAVAAGYRTAAAIPMRLRGTIIGALNLFRSDAGPLSDDDVAAAQALADVATIAILQHTVAVDAERINSQLTGALESRVVIEQAKGMIAERAHITVDQAFARLRTHARNHNAKLTVVARDVVKGSIHLDTPLGDARGGG